MNKTQRCRHMSRHFRARGRPVKDEDAREFLKELQRLAVRELRTAGHFTITKIAKLVIEPRARRKGRDPLTGKPMTIPARRIVTARISSAIRNELETTLRMPPDPNGRSAPGQAARRPSTR